MRTVYEYEYNQAINRGSTVDPVPTIIPLFNQACPMHWCCAFATFKRGRWRVVNGMCC
jgi:hypothetical protein